MKTVPSQIRTVNVTRYVTALREGGSLPAIAEADDGFLYVLKFRGAGQGVKALISEIIGRELSASLGLRVPELVFANLDIAFGRSEADEEIQDLLKASTGLNLALHYLSGSITFDAVVRKIESQEASRIVWLDSLILNVDRTAQNTNLLSWHKDLWLIDHGAALYFHHSWYNWLQKASQPFASIKDHVLLAQATELEKADVDCKLILQPDLIRSIVDLIPSEWLSENSPFDSVVAHREAYVSFLLARLNYSSHFTLEANHARESLI